MPKNKKSKETKEKKATAHGVSGAPHNDAPLLKVAEKQTTVVLPKHNGGKPKLAASGGSWGSAEMTQRKNAAAYLACLYSPHKSAPAMVPDLVSYPTSIIKQTYTQAYTGSTSDTYQVVFSPTLNTTGTGAPGLLRGFNVRSDVGTPGTYTANFTVTSDPNQGAMALYRTVAFGVQCVNITALLSRGGSVRMGRVAQANTALLPLQTNALSRDPRYPLFSLADADLENQVICWLPFDYESSLEMCAPGDTIDKGGVVFEFPPFNNTQNILFIVHHHIQMIPSGSISSWVEASSCPGSEADVATTQSVIDKMAGYAGGVLNSDTAAKMAAAAIKLWAGGGDSYGFGRRGAAAGGADAYTRRVMFAEAALRVAHRHKIAVEDVDWNHPFYTGVTRLNDDGSVREEEPVGEVVRAVAVSSPKRACTGECLGATLPGRVPGSAHVGPCLRLRALEELSTCTRGGLAGTRTAGEYDAIILAAQKAAREILCGAEIPDSYESVDLSQLSPQPKPK